jgi:hypothetical protein
LVREIEVVVGQYVVDKETDKRLMVGESGRKEKQEITIYVGSNLEEVIRFCLERGFGVQMN